MHVVIRSPHGEAEVSVDRNGVDATVADLVSAVTGEVAPATVFVDGHPVGGSEPLASTVLDGAVLDATWPSPVAAADAELVIVGGPGSGLTRRLSMGRYRIGPGASTRASELADGTSVDPRLELDVIGPGAAQVSAPGGWLGGVAVSGAVRWTNEPLRVGDHAFVLRPAGRREARRTHDALDGRFLFHRPPALHPPGAHPSVAQLLTWASTTDPALWHRRPGQSRAYVLPVGISATAADAPTVDLDAHRAVGVVADPDTAAGAARALVLGLVTLHGPADVGIVIATTADRAAAWEWVKWLPHARVGERPALVTDLAALAEWIEASAGARSSARPHRMFVVSDDPRTWTGRDAPLRARLAGDSALRLIAIADERGSLPAACTALLLDDGDDTITVDDLMSGVETRGVAPILLDAGVALDAARRLSPLEDPDLDASDPTALPSAVSICNALGFEEISGAAIRRRWDLFEGRPVTTIGAGPSGMVDVDLVTEGPHVLVAGSDPVAVTELLQTVVLGLAADCSPDDLEVLLVARANDSGLAACALLPHAAGLVTGRDEHSADRLLRCLRADLAARERELLSAGVTAFDGRWSTPSDRPRRLVVAIDGLDDLVTETPGFLPELLDVAQRGRLAGMHLLLGCSRPAEVLDARIRAQVALRIALRLDDEADSIDVVGSRLATRLPRGAPGRAVVRIGSEPAATLQTAWSSGHGGLRAPAMTVTPFVIARPTTALEQRMSRAARLARPDADQLTDAEALMGAIGEAARTLGTDPPRPVCPEPLPTTLSLTSMLSAHAGDGVPYALVDRPDEQRTDVRWWQPGSAGSALAYGAARSGPSSWLMTLALGAAERFAADDLHLYVIAADLQPFLALDELPHVGALARADDQDRAVRILRHLTTELTRRVSARTADEPAIVVMVDDVGQLLRGDRAVAQRLTDDLERVASEGPAVGICAVLTAQQSEDVPIGIARHIEDQLLLGADPTMAARFGFVRADIPPDLPGRGLSIADRHEIQIARPPLPATVTVAEIVAASPPPSRPPHRIDVGSDRVDVGSLLPRAHHAVGRLSAPIGIDARDRTPVALALDHGSVAYVVGPPGSGRSTALTTIGQAALVAAGDLTVYVLTHHPGPTDALGASAVRDSDVASLVDAVIADQRPRLILIDDADLLTDASLARLATHEDDALMLVVAGRPRQLRSGDHWTTRLAGSRTGLLLQPGPSDGEIVRVLLPPRNAPFPVGHGYLVNDAKVTPVVTATREPEP